ncbi:MAG: hypothetical protein EBR09_05090 [Proteobacteria bacterium]|nr:hypothetical protein [Pseudomonadota bacterium]
MFSRWLAPLGALSVIACGSGNPEQILRAEILNVGFIPYETPLEFAGTGTLVGGKPYEMQLIAPPESCFPNQISGAATNIRVTDNTELPMKSSAFQVTGNARVGLVDALGKGNSPLSVGVSFNKAQRVDFSYTRPKREYFDAIKLTDFYRRQIPEICKDYLDKVGFISEAIKVDEMRFKFYGSNGGAIDLTVVDPKTLVQVSLGTSWQVANTYELVITTPKYIGYRMGRLTRSDNGVSLCRAIKVSEEGSYQFECLDSFKDFAGVRSRSFVPPAFRVHLEDVIDIE